MSAPVDPRLERSLQRAMDLGERAFFVLLYASLFVRLWQTLAARPYNAVTLISESIVVFFILVRREAWMVSTRPMDWLIAVLGTALPLLITAGGQALAPPVIGALLMIVGLVVSVLAKLTLRRSFGLAAANRGLVSAGPYRIVRHPMYAGYALLYLGFFLNNPLVRNLVLYVVTGGLLVARILAEEIILAQDPTYAAFMHRVRYRLVPGLF